MPAAPNFLSIFPPVGQPQVQTTPQWQPYEFDYLRTLTGVPLLFTDFDPKFESAMKTVQPAPYGALPDNSTQQAIRTLMYNVSVVDQNLQNGANASMAIAVDRKDIVVNFALHRHINVREGSRYVAMVMKKLGLKSAFQDYFTGKQLLESWQDMFVMYV